eukprot:TRINITY_DN79932_c0_g1_i1.p1 TRINITY_DN79932_c0_g1~~TRINITY_DN79932_c0_g1_i1.p1  ORF type:complete len:192 (-),score=46.89 TRINITY_DN79932_c0_g1_i1:255-755(-)
MASIMRSALRGVAPRLLGSQTRMPMAKVAQPMTFSAFRAFSASRYTPTHEWVKVDGETLTMGISDFAQGALGEVVYCELPEVGSTFSAKDTICTLESVKAVGEVYAPADCEVVEVNEKLSDEPALVNSSCEEDGWLLKVKLSGDLSSDLMDSAAYEKHLESEKKEE